MKLQVGDVIFHAGRDDIFRVITEVRSTGYTWEYLHRGVASSALNFISENSTDPMFEVGWTLVLCGARRPDGWPTPGMG